MYYIHYFGDIFTYITLKDINLHARAQAHAHTRTHTQTQTYTHTHTHTHTHTLTHKEINICLFAPYKTIHAFGLLVSGMTFHFLSAGIILNKSSDNLIKSFL